jgi:hypothetical protein
MSSAEIRQAALKLTETERAQLAEELLASLDRPAGILSEDDPQLEARLLERLNDPRPNIQATPEFWRHLTCVHGACAGSEGI